MRVGWMFRFSVKFLLVPLVYIGWGYILGTHRGEVNLTNRIVLECQEWDSVMVSNQLLDCVDRDMGRSIIRTGTRGG